MSINPSHQTPQWDIADRLRKSLRQADIGVQEMADYLEVGRGTVSNWINGRNPAPGAALKLWAMRAGVSHEWLRDGTGDQSGPDDGLPRLDSNQEPTGNLHGFRSGHGSVFAFPSRHRILVSREKIPA